MRVWRSREKRIEDSARELEAAVGGAPKKREMTARMVERIKAQAGEMRAKKDWAHCKPSHLVALWAWCHESVYGVAPEEAKSPAQFARACMRAGQLVKASFGGEPRRAVELVRWTWTREKRLRAEDPERERRVGWGLQFSASLVSDYRVATAGRPPVPGK